MIRFCVVDDHQVILDGLQAMADREEGIEYAGGVTHLEEAVKLVDQNTPDLLILDLQVNGRTSLDTCAVIAQTFPDMKIMFFSSYGNSQLLQQAISAGAAGYALKDTNTGQLPEVIHTLHETGSYFDPRLSNELIKNSIKSAVRQDFTVQELKIIEAISQGLDTFKIAELLFISPHTVKYHVAAMLRNHKLQGRSELVHLAMSLHLLD